MTSLSLVLPCADRVPTDRVHQYQTQLMVPLDRLARARYRTRTRARLPKFPVLQMWGSML